MIWITDSISIAQYGDGIPMRNRVNEINYYCDNGIFTLARIEYPVNYSDTLGPIDVKIEYPLSTSKEILKRELNTREAISDLKIYIGRTARDQIVKDCGIEI